MKTKKILSLVLAMVMVLALAAPAFAAAGDADTPPANTTVISGNYQEADISVTVPGRVDAVIDPYGIGTSITESDGETKHSITGQIVSAPAAITNESEMNLTVGATVTGEILMAAGTTTTNALKFATTTTKGVGTDPEAEGYVAPLTTKSAFVNFEAVAMATAIGLPDDEDAYNDAIIAGAVADGAWDDATSINVGLKAVKVDDIATLAASEVDPDDPDSVTYKANSAVLIRLTGDCVVDPKVAWNTDDGIKVTIAFTFSPVVADNG